MAVILQGVRVVRSLSSIVDSPGIIRQTAMVQATVLRLRCWIAVRWRSNAGVGKQERPDELFH
jgi:hypothetical protein